MENVIQKKVYAIVMKVLQEINVIEKILVWM